MRVAELARSSVATLEEDDTLADAAREMEDNNVAAVVVCQGGVIVGILTERDLIRAASDGAPFERTALEEYMTASPVTLPSGGEPRHALKLMLDGGFRHIPVVDDDDDVVGLLTMRELVASIYGAEIRQAQPVRA